MNKIVTSGIIIAVMFLVVLGGCNGTPASTTKTQSTQTTQTTSGTLTTPANIEVEYELTDNETKGLLAVYNVSAVVKSKEVDVTCVVASIRIARSNVAVIAEFYDSTGTLIETLTDDYILDASQTHSSETISIKYYRDDTSLVAKCKLYITADE
jgi:hypothetical protein